jgi:hypothetical protein
MADAIVRYPARGQAPEIYATRLTPPLNSNIPYLSSPYLPYFHHPQH